MRVLAVSLDARDLMMLENGMGLTVAFPFVPASDLAGVVETVGDGRQPLSCWGSCHLQLPA